MFIGYPYTIESLTGAILDAHPEILIPQEYDVIGNWKMYQLKSLQDSGQQKHMLFFDMHYLSTFQAVFRNKANKPSQFWLWTSEGSGIHYNFVPYAWQGTISGKVKVKEFCFSIDVLFQLDNQTPLTHDFSSRALSLQDWSTIENTPRRNNVEKLRNNFPFSQNGVELTSWYEGIIEGLDWWLTY